MRTGLGYLSLVPRAIRYHLVMAGMRGFVGSRIRPSSAVVTRALTRSALAFAGLLGSSPQTQIRTFEGPPVDLPYGFTSVDGLRELADGRVLVLDQAAAGLMIVDFRTGTVRQVGRNGRGPAEYNAPTLLFALGRGMSAIRDDGNARTLLIDERGALGSPVDWDAAGGGPGPLPGMQRFIPSASDTLGRFNRLARPVRILPKGATELVDSTAIERLDARARRVDTVGVLHAGEATGRTLEPGTTRVLARPRARVRPLQVGDQWAISPDGKVAVVSAQPYRVTYFTSGARFDGPAIPYQPVRVTERDKNVWLAQRRMPRETWVVPTREARVSERTMAGGPAANLPVEWPKDFPPFLRNAVRFGPDGNLWIQRAVSVGDSPAIDIIDGVGRLSGRLTLPPRSRLGGFGRNGVVYIVRTDDDGLQFLQRYRLRS